MELSNVNFKVNANFNDVSSKTSAVKDKENSFSKVYKEVNNDTFQDKTTSVKNSDDSISKSTDTSNSSKSLDEDAKADKTRDDKNINNLIQLLLLSQGNNQNLVNLLSSGSSTSTKELQDLISKILKDNLEASNSLNLMQSSNGNPSIDEILKTLIQNSNSTDEDYNKLSINQSSVSGTLDKLAAVIANKLASDKTLRENIMSGLLEKGQNPSITGSDSNLKELIIKQLKTMSESAYTTSDNKELSEDKISTATVLKDNIFAAGFTSKNSAANSTADSGSYSEASNSLSSESKNTIAANKFNDTSSDKEDKLLQLLTENNSTKDSKNNVSDKIASILNRFETFKLDNQTLNEAKLTINKATLNQDFIKAVKFMDINNLKELSVKIIPKDLGEVVIRLSMENGIMKANITAANKDTYNLLNSQLPAINSELAKQNMTIQNFSLSLYNGDNFLFNGDGSSSENSKQQSRNNIKVDNLEEDLQKENYIEDNSTVNLLA
ncbi:flagellar hook-length control protein FliK [Candidatus Clostridium radicumherbarum]|uniref:Flagellar hook-length control protein FliK n=1 Tax=Candidatus Clostridium radicumherbarum TaxID=3381662 RepID=A0ABW8TVC5_9CLOT